MTLLPAGAAATRARQLFFERGTSPEGLIHDAILRSWQRCERQGRHAGESIVFNQVGRSGLNELLERHRQLLRAAEPAIHQLAQSMSGTGYGIILTDSSGTCLAAHGPIDTCGRSMRQALRPGVDLSENAIGTNAMCAAMSESRPIGIFGAEHYFVQHQSIQCIAAPIFSPDGAPLGAIDISRDTPGPQFGTLSMMLDCAAAIENTLLLETPAHLVIGLHWRADAGEQFGQALVAFGNDGEILALNRGARRLLGPGPAPAGLRYADLFCGTFGTLLLHLARSPHPVQLTLQSGLRIFACARTPARPASAAPRSPACSRADAAPGHEFGDDRVHTALRHAIRALDAGLPVMISGETGTGKEVAAHALHRGSACATGPFVAINCGAIPRELIEGELFGYADGAFTGARRGGAKGRIEEADGGTLFLDEIGDMPLDLQTRLLRVLESRQVTRLGESTPRNLAIQLISATHQDLDLLVREQRFRSDLYFRLSGMPLALPPLRERSDLDALIDTLLAAEGIAPQRLTPSARAALVRHSWPGNARELRTALRFAQAMADAGADILCAHLPAAVTREAAAVTSTPAPSATVADVPAVARSLKEVEWASMCTALAAAGGNVTAAARMLGISRATLHRRLKEAARGGAPDALLSTPAPDAG
jgi:transcriptional regulator of acetoin/glycerol metabolism